MIVDDLIGHVVVCPDKNKPGLKIRLSRHLLPDALGRREKEETTFLGLLFLLDLSVVSPSSFGSRQPMTSEIFHDDFMSICVLTESTVLCVSISLPHNPLSRVHHCNRVG